MVIIKTNKKIQQNRKGEKLIVAANAINRAKGTYGNGDGKDVAHKPGKEGSKNPKDATLQSPSKTEKQTQNRKMTPLLPSPKHYYTT